MKRIAIFVPENYLIALKRIARGRPVAELIRQAIDEFIKRHGG